MIPFQSQVETLSFTRETLQINLREILKVMLGCCFLSLLLVSFYIPYSADFSRGNNFVVFVVLKNPRIFSHDEKINIEPRPFKLKVKGRLPD